ncbi:MULTISPECIES: response regulator [unclassified Sinorhizobium]|uniref:response regulator n=1 Tax=unclassified Sinorhizobium TaxID=2613772 RepID=UPI003524EDEC
MACRRITDLDRPAYVKNSELRYVAVNDAYARFFARDVSDFIGRRSLDVLERPEEEEREDKERRALVFGSEETAICFNLAGDRHFRVHIESFMPSENRAYVLGLFEEAPAEPRAAESQRKNVDSIRDDGASGLPANLAEGALEFLDVGVCIYNADNDLIYANARWHEFYRPVLGNVELGVSLRWMLERVFDYWLRNYPEQLGSAADDREGWIAEQLEYCSKPHHDATERLCDGRWLRGINKRLENGLLIGLRIDITDIKEQELLLRRHVDETDLYRTILEDLPVAAFVRDANHRLVYANEAYVRVSGKERAEMLGKTEHEMFSTNADAIYEENAQAFRDGALAEIEGEMPSADGTLLPIVTRVNRVVTSDNKPYVVGSFTDISMLKLREKQLIEAQNRAEMLHQDLESVLRALPNGIMILDADLNMEFINDAFYEIWDLPLSEELRGRPFLDVIVLNHSLGRYGYAETPEEIFASRKNRFLSEDPKPPIELNWAGGKSVVFDSRRISNGRFLLSYVDISAVRRHEREIHETRNALERLGEMMKDATHAMSQGLLIVQEGVIILSNDALSEILRIPPDYLAAGKTWADTFGYCAARGDFGAESEKLYEAWQESIAAKRPISFMFHVAGECWVQMEAGVSERQHWMVLFTDVTEMKEREEELQRLLRRAETADRAKSEFLANMSHEIRTPMNGVLGMAELLARTDLDARQKTFIDIIVKSGNALLTIINDILDFSKIDAGQLKLRKVAFDPLDAVEDVASLLSTSAAEKDIELLVRAAPSVPPMVTGDAGRFRQIVTNLVGNAVKFTERGHVLVDIGCRRHSDGEIMLSLRVEDSGIGIPDEMLEKVFEKFSQVDGSSTRRHEGTGLGLAITAGLVDLFGGYIEVESEPGKGSAFTVHLPFSPSALREQKMLPVNVKGAHVLVIDDNEINRQILTEQLQMWGFDCVAAEDGAIGIAILEAAHEMELSVDAVILDYHMPEMNGADVARILRGDNRFRELPIIFLTSMDVAGSEKEFAALNGQAHLMKPARANVLRNTIVEVIRTDRARRSTAAAAALEAGPKLADREPHPADNAVIAGIESQLDVLVAEDNEVNQIVFTQILQPTGRRFLVVENGREAVDAYDRYRPQLIMMDISMPVMNGHEATRAIRAKEAATGGHVPIIGVTAHALDSDRDLCLEAGMDDYMSKPISPELLEAKMRRWLGEAVAEPGRSGL